MGDLTTVVVGFALIEERDTRCKTRRSDENQPALTPRPRSPPTVGESSVRQLSITKAEASIANSRPAHGLITLSGFTIF